MKTFALLSDESRLFHLGEYQERKKLFKRFSFVKSQLSKIESTYLSLVLSGKKTGTEFSPFGKNPSSC